MEEDHLEIAGVTLSLNSDRLILSHEPDPGYQGFLKKTNSPPDIRVRFDRSILPDTDHLPKIFDSGQSWSMFKNGTWYLVVLSPPALNTAPVWIARFDRSFKDVIVYLGERMVHETPEGVRVLNPVRYPMDQILLMYFLADRRGVLAHAAGVAFDGKGYIFPGRSGAGKSTLSRQFSCDHDLEILSDDRMVIREIGDTLRAYGTPWPGEAGIAINRGVPLSGIFFIRHGSQNGIRKMERKEALESLFPVVSVPWYDEPVMTEILDFCADLLGRVSAYELHFKPDVEVVDVFKTFVSQ